MNHATLRLLFAVSLTVIATTPEMRAQEGVSPDGGAAVIKIRSYGDERPVNVEEELGALRSANEGLAGSVQRQPLTFAAALVRVRDLARTAGGDAVLAPALQALPNREPTTLRLLAVRELARGHPTAVFLLLLAAYDRDPASPDALADLAGMLAGLGYANEALAFLDELKARNAVPSPPMEISGEDLLAYLRGYCLVRVGDIAAAKPLLAAVVARQPLLAEAARLLAIVSDDPAEQRKYLLLGVWRHRSPLMVCAGVDPEQPEPDPLQQGEEVAIDLRSVLDLGKGERGRLPDVTYARSVTHANGLLPVIEARYEAASEELRAISERQVRPKGFHHTEDDVLETRGHRMLELMQSLDRRDRRLRELGRARHQALEERTAALRKIDEEKSQGVGEALERFSREWIAKKITRSPTTDELGEVVRPFHESALKQARVAIQREEKAQRDYFAEWHLLASAIPAQVGDRAWWEYLRLMVEYQRIHSYMGLLSLARAHAHAGEHPWVTREPGETPASPEPQSVGKCDGDKSVSFTTTELPGGQALPFELGVEMTCEGMSVELGVDTRIPGISVSTELGVDTKGDFTAFVGPKATATLGQAGIAAFTGAAKGGAYVTANRNGVKDAGLKYEVKVGGGIGAVSAAQKIAEGKVSFMPAPAMGDGGIEPLIVAGGR